MMQSGTVFQLAPLVPLTDATVSGLWPTPAAMDTGISTPLEKIQERRTRIKAKRINGNGFGLSLGEAVRMWPTPNAGDWKAGMSNAPGRQQSSLPRTVGIVEGVTSGKRGGLNPTWVEWLMGFPLEWTVLKNWATPSSRKSRKSSVTPSSKA